MKYEVLVFLPARRSFTSACWAELETMIQILLKLSTALDCHHRKLLCKFSTQAIYLLDKTNQWNMKFWSSCLLEEISQFFGGLYWKPRFRFCWNFPKAFTCLDRKLLSKFSAQALYLLEKTNWWNLKFWPSCLLKEISQFFGRPNWKPRFRFCWNFPQTFTVWSGNGCLNFLLRQFIF